MFFCRQVKFEGCSDKPHLEFKGERYNLLQIHIHSPSEHMVRPSSRGGFVVHALARDGGVFPDLWRIGVRSM